MDEKTNNPLTWVSPQYLKKTNTELNEVMNSLEIVKEMLGASANASELKSNDILASLMSALAEIHTRLTQLILEIDHEDLLSACLIVNDHITMVREWHKAIAKGNAYKPAELPNPKLILA